MIPRKSLNLKTEFSDRSSLNFQYLNFGLHFLVYDLTKFDINYRCEKLYDLKGNFLSWRNCLTLEHKNPLKKVCELA